MLVEAITYRFRGHSMADPEEYRTKEQVEEWRKRDPILQWGDRLEAERIVSADEREQFDQDAIARVDDAVAFADESEMPAPESLYDDVYVLGGQVHGWYSVDERSAGVHKGEDERELAEQHGSSNYDGSDERDGRRPAADDGGRRGRRGQLSMAATAQPQQSTGTRVLRYREALNEALREEMLRDERVMLMGEDIGVFNGAFKVTAGLLEEFGEKRVRDTPISENTIVGMGVGAAMTGPAARGRAHDDQLLAARLRPDRQPRRPHPLHVRRPGQRPARRAHAPGRRPPARAHALALLRGPLPARARPARRRALDAGRRQGPAQGGHPRRQPGRSSSSTSTSTASAARSPRTTSTSSTSARPSSAARAPT